MSASSPTRSPSASPSSRQSGSLSSPCCADEVPTDRQNMSPRSSAGSTAGLRLVRDDNRTPSPGQASGGHRVRGPERASTPRDLGELEDEDEDVRMSEDEEDEIDVTSTADDNTTSGSCGLTPSAGDCSSSLDDEYFKPIKKLCMVQPRMRAPVVPPPPPPPSGPGGPATTKPLTSFFIKDILSHKPPSTTRCRTNNHHHASHNGNHHHVSAAVAAAVAAHAAAAAAAEPRGIVRPWDCGSSSLGRRRPRSADDDSRSEKSAESDSPESPAGSLTLNGAAGGGGGGHGGNAGNANSSPLDALFEMTSKAFEGLEANEKSSDGSRDHLNLFSNRQQPKKKRKSRTAFTNHQIFELEKRFLYQKYLSPADRDEIAQSLGLTNAQVITWFQNRRAKLKRDMEELKKDVDATTKVVHTTLQVPAILENIQDLSLLKKDTPPPHLQLHKAKQI